MITRLFFKHLSGLFLLVFMVAANISCSSDRFTEPDYGFVKGIVTEAGSDEPVVEALVFFTIGSNVVAGDTVLTDDQGYYIHSEWPGSYYLNVEKRYYLDSRQVITLTSNDTIEVNIELTNED